MRAAVMVTVRSDTTELAHAAQPIEVLAYDLWAGTRALPELLAAFCMPNPLAIDFLVANASKLLRAADGALSMDG